MGARAYANYIRGLLRGNVGGNPLTGQYTVNDGSFRLVKDDKGNPQIKLLFGGFTTDMTDPQNAEREWLREYSRNNPTSEYLSHNADMELLARRIVAQRARYKKRFGKDLPVVLKGYSRGGGAALDLVRAIHAIDPKQVVDEVHSLDGFGYRHEDDISVPKGSVKKFINVRSGDTSTAPIVSRGKQVQLSLGNLGVAAGTPLDKIKGVRKQVTVRIPGAIHENAILFNEAADRLARKNTLTRKHVRDLMRELKINPDEVFQQEGDILL